MGLYFSRLFLLDRYSVAPDKFGQKQLESAGVKVKIKSEITPDNARRSGASVGLCKLFQLEWVKTLHGLDKNINSWKSLALYRASRNKYIEQNL